MRRFLADAPPSPQPFIMQLLASGLVEFFVALIGGTLTGVSLWKMFRAPDTITVTRKDTGKSVVINPRADWKEGSKLSELL